MPDELYGRSLWRERVCQTCKQPFKSSRIDAMFCTPRCRQWWKRHQAPYPSAGTPAEVGPGLFDGIREETGMSDNQISAHLNKMDKIIETEWYPSAEKKKANKSQKRKSKKTSKPTTKKKGATRGSRNSK